MIRSDIRNKEIALGRIKRLASSGLPLEAFVRSIFDLVGDAIPHSMNRTLHFGGENANAYICNSPELNQVVPLHRRFYVEAPPENSGARFRIVPAELHRRSPDKIVWMHEELTLPNLYMTEGFHTVFRPWGFHHCLMVMFHESEEYLGCYPIWRSPDQPPFDSNDVKFVQAIAPSISHGLKVSRLLAPSAKENGNFQPVPGWGYGVLLVDRNAKVIARDPVADLVFHQLRVLDKRSGRDLPGGISESISRVAHAVCAAFSDSEYLFALPPPVSTIYKHWSGILLRFRGIRLDGVPGCEYITILIERGETLAARRKRFVLRWSLSDREAEVLALVGDGKTGPEISIILGITHDTARKHLTRIFEKLGVENRTEAALMLRDAT